MRQQSQGLAKLGAIFLGIGVAGLFVLINGFAAFNFIPSSYERFSWQAYAEVVYTNTPTAAPATPTPTPGIATATPTPGIPTATATITPTDRENSSGAQACSDGIDNDLNGLIDCADPACGGTFPCGVPAPAMSSRALVLLVVLFLSIGFFALTPLRFGRRR